MIKYDDMMEVWSFGVGILQVKSSTIFFHFPDEFKKEGGNSQ